MYTVFRVPLLCAFFLVTALPHLGFATERAAAIVINRQNDALVDIDLSTGNHRTIFVAGNSWYFASAPLVDERRKNVSIIVDSEGTAANPRLLTFDLAQSSAPLLRDTSLIQSTAIVSGLIGATIVGDEIIGIKPSHTQELISIHLKTGTIRVLAPSLPVLGRIAEFAVNPINQDMFVYTKDSGSVSQARDRLYHFDKHLSEISSLEFANAGTLQGIRSMSVLAIPGFQALQGILSAPDGREFSFIMPPGHLYVEERTEDISSYRGIASGLVQVYAVNSQSAPYPPSIVVRDWVNHTTNLTPLPGLAQSVIVSVSKYSSNR